MSSWSGVGSSKDARVRGKPGVLIFGGGGSLLARFARLEVDAAPEAVGASALLSGAESINEHTCMHEGDVAFRRGDFEEALRRFSRALEFNPNFAPAWTGQVRMLIEMGEVKEADVWASKALELFADNPELMAGRALASLRLGKRKDALAWSDASMEQAGHTAFVFLVRGEVLLATRGTQAVWCLQRALSLAPTDWLVSALVARVFYFHRHYARALEYAQKAVVMGPSEPLAWYVLGLTQRACGFGRQADESLNQALRLRPLWREATLALRSGGVGSFVSYLGVLFRRLTLRKG